MDRKQILMEVSFPDTGKGVLRFTLSRNDGKAILDMIIDCAEKSAREARERQAELMENGEFREFYALRSFCEQPMDWSQY